MFWWGLTATQTTFSHSVIILHTQVWHTHDAKRTYTQAVMQRCQSKGPAQYKAQVIIRLSTLLKGNLAALRMWTSPSGHQATIPGSWTYSPQAESHWAPAHPQLHHILVCEHLSLMRMHVSHSIIITIQQVFLESTLGEGFLLCGSSWGVYHPLSGKPPNCSSKLDF